MKSVLISVRPQWCEKIANGEKTIEIRKSRPKLETPFKCYIYCTIGGDALCPPHANSPMWDIHRQNNGTTNGRKMTASERDRSDYRFVNGKVIGEFVCDGILAIGVDPLCGKYIIPDKIQEAICLSASQLKAYGAGATIYAWHISALQIYDKPRELSEFSLTRPPQSWCYVEVQNENKTN